MCKTVAELGYFYNQVGALTYMNPLVVVKKSRDLRLANIKGGEHLIYAYTRGKMQLILH